MTNKCNKDCDKKSKEECIECALERSIEIIGVSATAMIQGELTNLYSWCGTLPDEVVQDLYLGLKKLIVVQFDNFEEQISIKLKDKIKH